MGDEISGDACPVQHFVRSGAQLCKAVVAVTIVSYQRPMTLTDEEWVDGRWYESLLARGRWYHVFLSWRYLCPVVCRTGLAGGRCIYLAPR